MNVSGFLLNLFLNALLQYITFHKCYILLPSKYFVFEGAAYLRHHQIDNRHSQSSFEEILFRVEFLETLVIPVQKLVRFQTSSLRFHNV